MFLTLFYGKLLKYWWGVIINFLWVGSKKTLGETTVYMDTADMSVLNDVMILKYKYNKITLDVNKMIKMKQTFWDWGQTK